jgi:hypothetical protein
VFEIRTTNVSVAGLTATTFHLQNIKLHHQHQADLCKIILYLRDQELAHNYDEKFHLKAEWW